MLKRFFSGFALATVLLIGGGQAAQAQSLHLDTGLTDAGGVASYNTTRSAADSVGLLIKAVVGLLGVIFLVLTLYAGFTWMTAAGEEKKVARAKGILTSSVIGLVICLLAYSITSFIVGQIQYTQQGVVTTGD